MDLIMQQLPHTSENDQRLVMVLAKIIAKMFPNTTAEFLTNDEDEPFILVQDNTGYVNFMINPVLLGERPAWIIENDGWLHVPAFSGSDAAQVAEKLIDYLMGTWQATVTEIGRYKKAVVEGHRRAA